MSKNVHASAAGAVMAMSGFELADTVASLSLLSKLCVGKWLSTKNRAKCLMTFSWFKQLTHI